MAAVKSKTRTGKNSFIEHNYALLITVGCAKPETALIYAEIFNWRLINSTTTEKVVAVGSPKLKSDIILIVHA